MGLRFMSVMSRGKLNDSKGTAMPRRQKSWTAAFEHSGET